MAYFIISKKSNGTYCRIGIPDLSVKVSPVFKKIEDFVSHLHYILLIKRFINVIIGIELIVKTIIEKIPPQRHKKYYESQ